MHINIAWQDVDTVLLDVDDTLLDLAFDNYFWQRLAPETQSVKNGVTPQGMMGYMRQQYHDVRRTLNWYCLDYWSEQSGPDIYAMAAETGPCVVLCEDTIPFLEALKANGKQRILLTNTHPYNLAVKLEHTGLDAYLGLLPPAHTLGYPKEDQQLWYAVAEATDLKAEGALFIDDNEAVLDAAVQSGIRYCLGMTNPDSEIAKKQYQRHPSLNDYHRPIPSLM